MVKFKPFDFSEIASKAEALKFMNLLDLEIADVEFEIEEAKRVRNKSYEWFNRTNYHLKKLKAKRASVQNEMGALKDRERLENAMLFERVFVQTTKRLFHEEDYKEILTETYKTIEDMKSGAEHNTSRNQPEEPY